MSPEHFDILILGSGQGGKLLAWDTARPGHRGTVVERRRIGGSCPNIACMPSKNVMWSARVAHLAHHAGQLGIIVGPVETMTRDFADTVPVNPFYSWTLPPGLPPLWAQAHLELFASKVIPAFRSVRDASRVEGTRHEQDIPGRS